MKKLLASITLAVVASVPLVVTTSSPALANNGSPPATCDFQQWYPGLENCDGMMWTIPTPTEMRRPRPKYWKVVKGDTLWHIAVMVYSTGEAPNQHAGQQYRKIMRLNHLRSTKIKVGQKLRVR